MAANQRIPAKPTDLPEIVPNETEGHIEAHEFDRVFSKDVYTVLILSGLIKPNQTEGTVGEIINLTQALTDLGLTVRLNAVTKKVDFASLPDLAVASPLEVISPNTANQKLQFNSVDFAALVVSINKANGFTQGGAVNNPPVFSNAVVLGTSVVGTTWNAKVDYTDGDNDAQGSSTIQWYTVNPDGSNPTPMEGATSFTNVPVLAAHVGRKPFYKAKPVAVTGTTLGAEITSSYGPVVVAATATGDEPADGVLVPIAFTQNDRPNAAIAGDFSNTLNYVDNGQGFGGSPGVMKIASGQNGSFVCDIPNRGLGYMAAGPTLGVDGFNGPDRVGMTLSASGWLQGRKSGGAYFGTYPNDMNLPAFDGSPTMRLRYRVDRASNLFYIAYSLDNGATYSSLGTAVAPAGDIFVHGFFDGAPQTVHNLRGSGVTAV